jgi:hypothetical protein
MASVFGWVDFDDGDRRRMRDIIDLLREQDTRDELGIATIRDALSERFFPGIIVIQTRARYFLFLPWMYLDLERKRPIADVDRKVRQQEMKLLNLLLATGETKGVIGRTSREKLKRLPSNIYWAGLSTWGIRRFPGSHEAYHELLGREPEPRDDRLGDDDRESANAQIRPNWDPRLPTPPADWKQAADLALTREEAEYLRDRVALLKPRPLLAHLVEECAPTGDDVPFAWMHPEWASFPDDLRAELGHARNFAEVMHGAAILYNLMLAEKSRNEEQTAGYADWLGSWAEEVSSRASAFHSWSRADFWRLVLECGGRIHPSTERFVNSWLDLALGGDPQRLGADPAVRELLRRREAQIKGPRARLANDDMLRRWSGAAGTRRLDFRWNTARDIVNDILLGLGRERS